METNGRVLTFPGTGVTKRSQLARCPNCFTMNSLSHLGQKVQAKSDAQLKCALCGTQLQTQPSSAQAA